MTAKILKWGNSLALRIPKIIAKDVGIDEGSQIDIQIRNDCLILRPLRSEEPDLNELLANIDEENLHSEFDWGEPMGNELW